MAQEFEKESVAKEAVKLVKNDMIVGLGTGSSAEAFIKELVKRVQHEHLKITCVPTSISSKKLIEGIIPFISDSLDQEIDITFDGADKIDPYFNLIKGGGAALLREKLVAYNSRQNIVLVDYTKLCKPHLEGHPLPLELVPFGYASTIARIHKLGYQGRLRVRGDKILLSDNRNYLYDILFEGAITHPEEHHKRLKSTLGVIETGFFLQTAQKAYVGYPNNIVKIIAPESP